jgi:ATP-dependent helicase HrpA
VTALGDFIYRRFGVDIPAASWSNESLPDYLKMRISITAPNGKELHAGRDTAVLRRDSGGRLKSNGFEAARKKWEKNGISRWDFGELPDVVSDSGKHKADWVAYPALEKESTTNKSVNLRLFRRQVDAIEAHRVGVATLYTIHFSKNLKLLKRQLILPADIRFMADYFSGAKKLVQQMYDRIIEELFAKNIRSEKAFYGHAESVTAKIFPTAQELRDKTIPVLTAYHEARSRIYQLQQINRTNSMAVSFFEELTRELERLVPQTFVAIYDIRRLDHLPRYIQAAVIRARRASVDFEKDRAKASEIIKFTEGLNQLLKELSPAVSDEKRQAIEAYFWMVEEYKVSVFAQELKTAGPISAKRLDKKLNEIRRMV